VPKAIISNRIYLEKLTDPQLKHITASLTYAITKNTFQRLPSGKLNPKKEVEYLKSYKLLPGGIVTIPQGRTDLIPEDYEIVDRRVVDDMPYPEPKIQLREKQLEIYNALDDSALINAKVGFGKTFLALHIAKKLAQKTLVVTHTTALRDQWIEECRNIYGFDPGVIGSGKFDIEDKVIVIGNIQSLLKHTLAISKEFGTVMVDECLDYETTVYVKDVGPVKIGTIVNGKKQVEVLSLNTDTGTAEYKPIKQWFKTPEKHCLKIQHSGGGSIKCTANHNVYRLSAEDTLEKVPAGLLVPGDLIAQSTVSHKSTQILHKDWIPLILGLTLGDGNLGYPHAKSDSIRLKITHGQDQKEFLDWKASILETAGCTYGETKSGYGDKKVFSISTKSFFDQHGFYDLLYPTGHSKISVPKFISNQLTKEAWALIFQDDGSSSKSTDSIVFSFCELDDDSIDNLQQSLKNVFDIESVFYRCKKGYAYIRLNQASTLKFLTDIQHLLHPSMLYKAERFLQYRQTKEFDFPVPSVPVFMPGYALRAVTSIETSTLTNGYKYNIEVADNHNYFANNILVSNCHHTPASTFTELVDSMYARYRIGLSGTLERKDGKHVLLKDYFSNTVYQPPVDNTLEPVVHILKPGVFLESGLPWAQKINKLLYDDSYQKFIADLAKAQIERGHSVLVIASRVEFLERVKHYVGQTCVLVTGDTDFEARKRAQDQINSEEKRCIAGSRQIFSEGISVNRLSAVILAEPMSHTGLVEQIIGRVQRQHPKKPAPEVFDVNFSDRGSKNQNETRLGFYLEKGWPLKTY
jgi:superfamily II DNA or RNA helicase